MVDPVWDRVKERSKEFSRQIYKIVANRSFFVVVDSVGNVKAYDRNKTHTGQLLRNPVKDFGSVTNGNEVKCWDCVNGHYLLLKLLILITPMENIVY